MVRFRAFYNEIDSYCCDWLSNLMDAGLITPGVISNQDVRDVRPEDLLSFDRCHFFAGIGVWDYALNCAGWGAAPVWTGSAPCQPFSAAGGRAGFADERHLWPAWHHLIRICRPPVVFGEQVASKDGLNWFDLVQADMESEGYAIGATDLCAAGVGAPHIRQRLWFVAERMADANGGHAGAERQQCGGEQRLQPEDGLAGEGSGLGRMADSIGPRLEGHAGHGDRGHKPGRIFSQQDGSTAAQGVAGGVADANSIGAKRQSGDAPETARLPQSQCQPEHDADVFERGGADRDGRRSVRGDGVSGLAENSRPTDGFWRDTDWLFCRDGKWRPVEPGTFPLVDGAPARVGRLRGYGNAIVAPVAQAFIEAASGRVCVTAPSVITTDEDVFS